ncbi:MAG: HEAT repeat protein [Planctomycetota bacterium]
MLLAQALVPSAQALSSVQDAKAPRTPLEYFQFIRENRDQTPRARIEELGQMKTSEALEMLKRSVGEMRSRWGKQHVFSAMRFFMDDAELSQKAIKFARTAALRRDPMESRAAAGAMVGWGVGAKEALYEVAEDAWEDVARAEAIRGLHSLLLERKDDAALTIMLEAYAVPASGSAAKATEIFCAFRSEGHFKLMKKFVGGRNTPQQRMVVVIDAMGAQPSGLDPVVDEGVNSVLEEALRHRDPMVQFRALVAVAQRGGTSGPKSLAKLAKSKDRVVKRAAIIALLRTQADDSGSRALKPLELAESDDGVVRQAAAIGLGDRGGDEALEALHRLIEDEDWHVRAEAIRSVTRLRHRSSIPVLIDGLGEAKGRLTADFNEALLQLTAKNLGLAAGRWRIFWSKEGETFQVPSPEVVAKAIEEQAKRKEASESTVAFYGLNVLSEAFVMVVDTSGSMNAIVGEGKTRLDVAKEQMAKTLNRVQDGILFNVIPFADGARPLSDGLTTMDEKAREEALAFVAVLREAGSTNIYDGLSAAFEDERVDTVYLLSDGSASVGELTDVTALRAEVERWNSIRGILIHAIAVGQDHPLLKGLAEDSGGKYVRVE